MTATASRQTVLEARRAAARAARANWGTDTTPRCTIPGCSRYLHRAGRCQSHWQPLRDLLGTMAGESAVLSVSRRAFGEAMHVAGVRVDEWNDLADADLADVQAALDGWTDRLYAAGYYVGCGPRGGRYLSRKS